MRGQIRRVAITGAAGYVGTTLIRRLEQDDGIERILATDIRPLKEPRTSKVVFKRHDIDVPMGPLLSEHGIEAIVHLAFIMRPGHNRAAIERTNVGGTTSVLNACVEAGVRHIVYLSSTAVYGARPDNPSMLTEESPLRPIRGFHYSEHKAKAEQFITELTQRYPTFKATILRTCPVMGPNSDNFISDAFTKPFLVGVRGYDPPLQLLHEDDLAKVLSVCLLQGGSGTYNLAGRGVISWSEMASIFGRKLMYLPAPLLYALTGITWNLRLQRDSPASGLDFIRYRWTVSTEKIEKELGITIQHSSKQAWETFARRPEHEAPANEADV